MNYYYDLILNWSEDTAFYFYEWNDTDSLELIKKIPIFKVKHKTFLDLIQNKVKIDEDTMLLIKDKTILGTQSLVTKIEYASLFTDGKNVIAIEFNKEGESAFYSNLLIDDELNVLEICYNLKEYTCFYEILAKKDNNHLLRQEKEAKDLITLEIKNLYQTKNYLKLKYLYYEYQKEQLDDVSLIYKHFLEDLKGPLTQNILKLYYIIKLSYHNV